MFKLMLNCLEISASATRLANNEGLPANMASFLHVCMFDQHGLKRNLNKNYINLVVGGGVLMQI